MDSNAALGHNPCLIGISRGVPFASRYPYQDVLAEGEEVGEVLMFRKLLARRIGPLPGWAEQRLNQATSSQPEPWA